MINRWVEFFIFLFLVREERGLKEGILLGTECINREKEDVVRKEFVRGNKGEILGFGKIVE